MFFMTISFGHFIFRTFFLHCNFHKFPRILWSLWDLQVIVSLSLLYDNNLTLSAVQLNSSPNSSLDTQDAKADQLEIRLIIQKMSSSTT